MTLALMALLLLHAPPGPCARPAPEPPVAVDPSDAELSRFPPRIVAEQGRDVSLAHWGWLNDQACMNTDRAYWGAWVREADWTTDAWIYLCNAHRSDAGMRAYYLEMLREVIGDEAYQDGRMPEPIPPSHVRVIDP